MNVEIDTINQELIQVLDQLWANLGISPTKIESTFNSKPQFNIPTFVVTVSGAWNGVLATTISQQLAQLLTRKVYHLDGRSMVSDEDIIDWMKEITNVAAGNLKVAVPEPSILSVPKLLTAKETEELHMKESALVNISYFFKAESISMSLYKGD